MPYTELEWWVFLSRQGEVTVVVNVDYKQRQVLALTKHSDTLTSWLVTAATGDLAVHKVLARLYDSTQQPNQHICPPPIPCEREHFEDKLAKAYQSWQEDSIEVCKCGTPINQHAGETHTFDNTGQTYQQPCGAYITAAESLTHLDTCKKCQLDYLAHAITGD